ncbi:MAG: type I-C CRISPR-associated protein Cas7/Csd2 [Candidatus Brocadia carolinensis]|uniref:Type I-C CRISPR-associated protein Cas7/Csd2 n=1 Tax=Candidatus Brocadia carolinensis TaxID=1004156 RepID=A0A1V4ARH7_9BACT|nr:MAG: type I-C CRISPR-associated protein Cas7/Csd2 [Candidatus Brocadia caroliniensis]
MPIITNRHDVLFLFDVVNGNPNGDPDAGNLPRIDPSSNRGLVSDVCLKRKIRNYVLETNGDNLGYDIFVRSGAVLNRIIKEEENKIKQTKNETKRDSKKEKHEFDDSVAFETVQALSTRFYDIRTFGAVVSTGEKDSCLTGSPHGQIRGPVQFSFAQSLHPIVPLEISVTRCAVTNEEDIDKERTFGNKHIIPYALYLAKIYISPIFAGRQETKSKRTDFTGFSDDDLNVFFEALQNMFMIDQSAARPEMNVRGIFDFEHVGTQDDKNAEQKKREARLGCYHAHKLFDGIKIDLSEDAKKKGKTYPESFGDYSIKCEWSESLLPKGVNLHLRHEGRIIQSNNGK